MRSAISRMKAVMLRRKTVLDMLILAECVMLGLLTVLCIWLGTTAQSEVSFVEISLDGTAHYIPDGRKLLKDWTPPDVLQERLLKTFIQGLRSVSKENEENYNGVMRALWRTEGQAYSVVASYLQENSPGERNKSVTVTVPYQDIGLTRYDEHTWKIVWREITKGVKNNDTISDRQYEAIVRTSYRTPSGETAREWNPSGVYISYMDSDLLRSWM